MFREENIHRIMEILKREAPGWDAPVMKRIKKPLKDPFKILISCILSLRTKDEVTHKASENLFKLADNPRDMINLKREEIERAIYSVGFYRNKAETILDISKELVERYGSKVPDSLDELLKLRGVGRKTANLVISRGYNKPGICVDTHVHRITNRWGYVSTRTPYKTELALRKKLPKEYFKDFNYLLVALGQSICRPISPLCTQCPIQGFCERVGVKSYR